MKKEEFTALGISEDMKDLKLTNAIRAAHAYFSRIARTDAGSTSRMLPSGGGASS